jgi:hypothetical protein
MNYLKRYLNGEFEQVWSELQALGPAVRQEPDYLLAQGVASETMSRVRRNCELLVSRLNSLDYVFGIYPDGSNGYFTSGPLVPPSKSTRADCAKLEERAGSLPLSLKAFWHEVGSVDFVGMHPSWPAGLDPLVVNPPEAVIYDLEEFDDESNASDQFEVSLAPDYLHKDNISGGSPYSIAIPNPCADSVFLNEQNSLLFVQYLRLAILRWGGFPGLALQKNAFEPLANLTASLEPF